MPSAVSQKLRIHAGDRILPINAPPTFSGTLGSLPRGASVVSDPALATQLHWFVTTSAQVQKEVGRVLKRLQDGMVLWTYYPKGSSALQTDLTRDKGWDAFTRIEDLQWIGMISFDETWSVFGSRRKTERDRRAEAKPKVREIFNWIDPERKSVRLPEDFSAVLKKSKSAETFFNTLSFTNRKEYVEWVVTAKRPETRSQRLSGSVERLEKRWKNPRNL